MNATLLKLTVTLQEIKEGPERIHIGDCTITRSQLYVLVCLSMGLSEKQVATLLCRSVKTVQKHSQNIKKRTGIRSNIGLAHFAIKHGLINAGDYTI